MRKGGAHRYVAQAGFVGVVAIAARMRGAIGRHPDAMAAGPCVIRVARGWRHGTLGL